MSVKRKTSISLRPATMELRRNTTCHHSQLWLSTATNSVQSTLVIWWTKMRFWNGSWTLLKLLLTWLNLLIVVLFKFWSMTSNIWPFSSVRFDVFLIEATVFYLFSNFRQRQMRNLPCYPREIGNNWWWHWQAQHSIRQDKRCQIGSWNRSFLFPCFDLLRDWRSNHVRWWDFSLMLEWHFDKTKIILGNLKLEKKVLQWLVDQKSKWGLFFIKLDSKIEKLCCRRTIFIDNTFINTFVITKTKSLNIKKVFWFSFLFEIFCSRYLCRDIFYDKRNLKDQKLN